MQKIDFNRSWRFAKIGCEYTTVNIPHDAMILEKRDSTCKNAATTGWYAGGKYSYIKKWFVTKEFEHKSVSIEFEGIYDNSEVFINGKKAGGCAYGYSGFTICLDEYLNYEAENEIRVTCDTSKEPNTRWYTGSGMYRPVWLHIADNKQIKIESVKVKTITIAPAKICVSILSLGGSAQIEILYNKQVVALGSGNNVEIVIPNAKLWADDCPNLYECRVSLYNNEKIADQMTEKFGIRQIECSNKGLYINGVETLLRGACIHHDNGVLGACAFSDAEKRKIKILKESGFNAVRSAHNPCSKALLDACDELGVYVIDEFSDMWYIHKNKYDYVSHFDNDYEKDLTAIVNKDFNHPSVIMYSLGNEVTETAKEKGVELIKRMKKVILNSDDSRAITCGINISLNVLNHLGYGLWKEDGEGYSENQPISDTELEASGSEYFNKMMMELKERQNKIVRNDLARAVTENAFAALDVAGYNYGTGRYDLDATQYPDRVVVGTETLPPKIAENWNDVKKYPYVIGDFMWTGWDYIGEAGIGAFDYEKIHGNKKKFPFLLAGCGVIDICGLMRPEVWLNKCAFGLGNGKPYIGVEPVSHSHQDPYISMWRFSDAVHSWAWAGCEGKSAVVIIYSDAYMVELLLNGKSIGKQNVELFKSKFSTVYQPGELVAIAYDNIGKEVGRDILHSAATETVIIAKPDKEVLIGNGQELCYIDISFADRTGIVKSEIDSMVTVRVEGSGVLAGLGSANPCTEEGFASDSHSAFYGRAQAVIRSGYIKGDIKVIISSNGVADSIVYIKVV